MTTTSDLPASQDPRWLVGLLGEYSQLLEHLASRQRVVVVEADPLSGATGIVSAAAGSLELVVLSVDARPAANIADLANSIAMKGVAHFAPEAVSWWNSGGQHTRESFQFAHSVSQSGIDLESLRLGKARHDQLRRVFELLETVTNAPLWLFIDHLDDMLERLRPADRDELLGSLRAQSQVSTKIHQLLVGRTAGQLSAALNDPDHPLFRAGDQMTIRRPNPRRFVDDLAIGRPSYRGPIPLLGAAAELAAGAPPYVWRIVEAASTAGNNPRESALAAWRRLQNDLEPSIAQQFVLAGAIHRSGPEVLIALAKGTGPYELPLNPKTVRDALNRMRARGMIFSPGPQRWAISDPALAAWARARTSAGAGTTTPRQAETVSGR